MENYQEKPRCREWPGGYREGMAVIHLAGGYERFAHVVAVPKEVVPDGCVPIMYDDEAGCFVTPPVDDLKNRFKSHSPKK